MTFTYRYRKLLLIISCILVLSVVLCLFLFQKQMKKKTTKQNNSVVLAGKKEETKEETKEKVETYYQVDIKGEVNIPGIYSVKQGSRVIDVIRLAGDLTEAADTSVINLSKKVTDEMVIVIYSQEEVREFTNTKAKEEEKQQKCIQVTEDAVINDACIDSNASKEMTKISINQATLAELKTLNGIGEAKAAAIIAYREEHGPFSSVEEIKNVDGIGEDLFVSIKENITL